MTKLDPANDGPAQPNPQILLCYDGVVHHSERPVLVVREPVAR